MKPSPAWRVPSESDARRLVILSVPFTRNARLLLADRVLEALLKHADVLVVSPHANLDRFRAEFGRPGVDFLRFDGSKVYRNRLRAVIYGVTEILRMRGFHKRFRNILTAPYWALRHVDEGWNGAYTKKSWPARVATSLAAAAGSWWRGAWRVLERATGWWLFDDSELRAHTQAYQSVTLVQSASFGEQDRFLAFAARRLGFRTAFVPYTTDQLTVNGYLMSDFDVVCPQSDWEAGFATRFHSIPAERIRIIGNLWFRHIDALKESIGPQLSPARERVILFAGISARYFPRMSEFLAVDTILRAIEAGQLGRARLVYRAIVDQEGDHAELMRRYGSHPSVEVQVPQVACIGMLQYPERPYKMELQEFVSQLQSADVIIMCFQNGICLDAAYLGRPVISYCADPSGMLQLPNIVRMLDDDLCRVRASGVPEVHSVEQLVPCIANVLADRNALRKETKLLVGAWDFQKARSIDLLVEALFPSGPSASYALGGTRAIVADEARARQRR